MHPCYWREGGATIETFPAAGTRLRHDRGASSSGWVRYAAAAASPTGARCPAVRPVVHRVVGCDVAGVRPRVVGRQCIRPPVRAAVQPGAGGGTACLVPVRVHLPGRDRAAQGRHRKTARKSGPFDKTCLAVRPGGGASSQGRRAPRPEAADPPARGSPERFRCRRLRRNRPGSLLRSGPRRWSRWSRTTA